jgi:tyrosyl-tRNA synthetase
MKKSVITDENAVNEVMTRGVEEVFVRESLNKRLRKGEPLRIKLGFDPTGDKIHIGRAVILRKLKALQDMGHTVVFIVGDFTAQIGDPSDKLQKRPMLSKEKIEENLKTYKEQVGKIVDISKAEFHRNSTWLSKLGFQDVCELAESFSVQQMAGRRNFKERFDKDEEVSLREFLYPLMQGYDSVVVNADVEIGGLDQLFNLKAGRTIQRHYGKEEQDILTVKMLPGTDGRKMSTSWGNVINIVDEPQDMFGKVMSLNDGLILEYFVLATDVSMSEIAKIEKELEGGQNPKEAKMRLAREIVSLYHSEEKGREAENNFNEVFKKGGLPEDLKTSTVKKGEELSEVLVREEMLSSKSEFRRLVSEGAVSNAKTGRR